MHKYQLGFGRSTGGCNRGIRREADLADVDVTEDRRECGADDGDPHRTGDVTEVELAVSEVETNGRAELHAELAHRLRAERHLAGAGGEAARDDLGWCRASRVEGQEVGAPAVDRGAAVTARGGRRDAAVGCEAGRRVRVEGEVRVADGEIPCPSVRVRITVEVIDSRHVHADADQHGEQRGAPGDRGRRRTSPDGAAVVEREVRGDGDVGGCAGSPHPVGHRPRARRRALVAAARQAEQERRDQNDEHDRAEPDRDRREVHLQPAIEFDFTSDPDREPWRQHKRGSDREEAATQGDRQRPEGGDEAELARRATERPHDRVVRVVQALLGSEREHECDRRREPDPDAQQKK